MSENREHANVILIQISILKISGVLKEVIDYDFIFLTLVCNVDV